MIRTAGDALWQKSTKHRQATFKVVTFRASGIFALVFLFVFGIIQYQAIADMASAAFQIFTTQPKGVTSYVTRVAGSAAIVHVAYAAPDDSGDADKDGLSNHDELIYGTNALDPDTDKDGYLDGEEVANGYNPAGAGLLPSGDKDNDGLSNDAEEKLGLDPLRADTDGDGFSDVVELTNGFDPTNSTVGARPQATLAYASLGITVPIVDSASTSESDLSQALEHGAVRYPGSAFPGTIGNSFISGHSSDYVWKQGDYKDVFAPLLKTNTGDTFTATWKFSNGHSETQSYQVKSKDIVDATDKRFFEKSDSNRITLGTCWPLGTSWRRLMVIGESVGTPEYK